MSLPDWAAIIVALSVSLLSPWAIRPLLVSRGFVDRPTERSSHTTPVIRGGGLSTLVGFSAGMLVLLLSGGDAWAAVIAGVGASFAILGLVDDAVGLRVALRLPLQLVLGIGGGVLLAVALHGPVVAGVLGGLAIAAYVNMANFMDGIDGISSLHGLGAGVALALLGVWSASPALTTTGAILAVSFLAFLPWNVSGSKMFLGDVGSYLLGAVVAAASLSALLLGIPWPAVVGALSIYVADTGTVVVRRLVRGEPWWEAHRQHVYQRIVDSGRPHLRVATWVLLFQLSASALGGISLVVAGAGGVALGACGVLLVAGIYLALPRLLKLPAVAGSYELAAVPLPDPGTVPTAFEARTWGVVGASGFVGSAVVKDLKGRGLEVREIRAPRFESRPQSSDGRDVAAASAQLADGLVGWLDGCDVVVNAAGSAEPGAGASPELYGANALLPSVVARAASRAGVARFVHLSSAAVQGRRPILDESPVVQPFSPYSRSKALGERSLLVVAAECPTDVVIVRATSVQGTGRPTTRSLQRVAASRIASVAAPGTQPSTVSSVTGLAAFVFSVGSAAAPVPRIVLQPWEGLSARDVLEHAGGRTPLVLPAWLCRVLVTGGMVLGSIAGVVGAVRRVEVMWFGQRQADGWGGPVPSEDIVRVLQEKA